MTLCYHVNDVKDFVNIILAFILAVSTVYLARYTYLLVKETRIARKAQLQPALSIHIEQGETDVTLIFIIFRNIGQGAAYDLKFDVILDIGDYKESSSQIASRGLFSEGMKFCPPGYQKKYFLLETTKEYELKMVEQLKIKAKYKNVFKEPLEDTFHIHLSEQHRNSSINPPDTYIGQIAKSLKQIEVILGKKPNNN